jgi:hypothetical protein
MMGKLPKSEAWKQSDPTRLGLLPHPRYLSRDSVGICRFISIEVLPHTTLLVVVEWEIGFATQP